MAREESWHGERREDDVASTWRRVLLVTGAAGWLRLLLYWLAAAAAVLHLYTLMWPDGLLIRGHSFPSCSSLSYLFVCHIDIHSQASTQLLFLYRIHRHA
jgi:hypothetical protein